MPPTSRIPPLLQPYVRLPQNDSIFLVTSTLGASANWLVVRFLYDALNSHNGSGGDEGVNVVLVSWMREYEFWKQETRKGGGLDLDRLRRERRLVIVDALSGLFMDTQDGHGVRGHTAAATQLARPPGTLPVQSTTSRGPLPARSPPATLAARQAAQPASESATPTSKLATTGLHTLQSPDLAHLKTTILDAVGHLHASPDAAHRKTLLVLDNPDVLLATSARPVATLTGLTSLILTLHEQIPHVLIHMQSDTPLITLSTPTQPIEHAQHNFLVKLAHMSSRILSVRVLDTGVARDVSGVLRVTENTVRMGGVGLMPREEEDERREGEVLYKIGADGGVRVFERGAGGDA